MKNFTGRIFFPRVLLEGFFESFKGTFFSRDNFHHFLRTQFLFSTEKNKQKKNLEELIVTAKLGINTTLKANNCTKNSKVNEEIHNYPISYYL